VKRYSTGQIVGFLRALDGQLREPLEIIIIGGSAASLAYGVDRTTRDIDTWGGDLAGRSKAISAARKVSGHDIPIEVAGVADAPAEFEERLEPLKLKGLVQLSIRVPEKHDLVLMKMLRGYEHDLETAAEIHAKHGLELEILISRYLGEMGHIVGDRRATDLNFLALVERLFDESRLAEAERRLRSR